MPLWVGDATGARKSVLDPRIGDGSQVRQIQKAWVGDSGGVPRLVYTRTTPVNLTATVAAYNQINLSWTGGTGPFTVKRGTTTIYTGSGTSKNDTGLSASTTYNYTITDAYGSTDTASAKTSARPTASTTVTLNPTSKGSYSGNGSLRNSTGPFYSGNYTPGSNGRQKSAFIFAIPAAVRNCVAVTKVEFACQNDHSYSNAGVTQSIGLTHTSSLGSTWPGSTGPFGARATAKDGWWGNAQWQNITSLKDPTFNLTVAENFRTKGAWGVTLEAPSDDIGYYSYWHAAGVQLRLTYSYYTA